MKIQINKVFKNSIFYHLLIITVMTLAMVYFFCYNGKVFGSTIDWLSQHSVIPEYFRQQFYATGDIISEFAMNFGAGQNAFNYIYHGYLTPVILISYLLPFVPMKTYIIGSSIGVMLLTLYLFYYWLLKKNLNKNIVFCTTLLFLFSTSFFFHSHKQIMFVQYMPFLMMALIGIDRMFLKKKRGLLVVSVFLMLLTNYFFSVSSILVLSLYAIYQFMTINEKFTVKEFFSAAISYAMALINSVLLSAFALFPAFFSILSGRSKSTVKKVSGIADMLFPSFNIINILYSPYGMGLTCISLIAVFYLLFTRRKNNVFLSLSLLIVSVFPIVTYILNIFLYDHSKIYIPFIPVVLMITGFFLNDIFINKKIINYNIFIPVIIWLIILLIKGEFLYSALFGFDILFTCFLLFLADKYKQPRLLLIPLMTLACIISISISSTDKFVNKRTAREMFSPEKQQLVNSVLKSEDYIYRSNDLTHTYWTSNYIYNRKYYQTGLYSSIYNKYYNKFTHKTINLSNTTVNDIATVNTNDWLFNRFMGVKYIICDNNYTVPKGYIAAESLDSYTICKNDDIYSVMFATNHIMSLREFNELSPADRKIAILGYIIVDDDSIENVYTSPLKELKLNEFDKIKGMHVRKVGSESVSADVSGDKFDSYIVEITLPKHPKKQTNISVNGIFNALSSTKNAYPKSNLTFSYVITSDEAIDSLDIIFYGGDYTIESVKCYGFNSDDIEKISENITCSDNVTLQNDNKITGDITLKEDGYINFTIPYDKGFSLYIDGKKVPYEITDSAFIGASLQAGTHNIRLVYNTPGLTYGIIITVLGILLLISILVHDILLSRKSVSSTVQQ